MKRLTVMLLSAALLIGCGSSTVEQGEPIMASGVFERHSIDRDYAILVDKETKACYLEYKHSSGYAGHGGITVMLNADGTPKLWEE